MTKYKYRITFTDGSSSRLTLNDVPVDLTACAEKKFTLFHIRKEDKPIRVLVNMEHVVTIEETIEETD